MLTMMSLCRLAKGERAVLEGAVRQLADHPSEPDAYRSALQDELRACKGLEELAVPDAVTGPAAARLLGASHKKALDRFGGIVMALLRAESMTEWVHKTRASALATQSLWQALRVRATAVTYGFDKAPVTDLRAFSMPPELWKAFQSGMDAYLRRAFLAYSQATREAMEAHAWDRPARLWRSVCQPVAVGQSLTLQRGRGRLDTGGLVSLLAEIAVASPPESAWHGWAVGYHAAEAASSLLAGLDRTAEWHAKRIRSYDEWFRDEPLLPERSTSRGR
jgi:hypothetical protein